MTLKEIEKAFCEKGLEITESQKRIVKIIQENQIISIKQIKTYLTMLLTGMFLVCFSRHRR